MLKALTTYMLQALTAAGSMAPRSAPGHGVCPGGLETAASGPSSPTPLLVGGGTPLITAWKTAWLPKDHPHA